MNINFAIITLYNSINAGAYLQAYALKHVIEKYGEVYHIKTGARSLLLDQLKMIVKGLLKLQIKRVIADLMRLKTLYFCQREFNIIKPYDVDDSYILIYGSDVIWNASKRNYYSFPILFGARLSNKLRFSYAPGVANATIIDFFKHPRLINSLQLFDYISVRDEHSRSVISELTGKPVSVMCDPCFLLTKQDWETNIKSNEKLYNKPYIAMYIYASQITSQTIKNIKKLSEIADLELYSLFNYYAWCQYNVMSVNVFNYYINAKYVITSTFHGTVFAIIHNKQFVVVSENNEKVTQLITEFGLSDRQLTNSSSDKLREVLEKPIDYININRIWSVKRLESLKFIDDCIKAMTMEYTT